MRTARASEYHRVMVRRDDDERSGPGWDEGPWSRCVGPAGASPVPVGGNAPGRRLPGRARAPVPKRSVESPSGGESRAAGGQHANLRAGELGGWTREAFENLGLCRLRGIIRFPERPFWQQEGHA